MQDYTFLKRARVIFKILSWVLLTLGVIVGVIVFITGGAPTGVIAPDGTPVPPTPKAAGIVFLIMGAFYFLVLYTVSEMIGLLLDIKGEGKPVVSA